MENEPPSPADDFGPFYHGTKADLKRGDLLEPGYRSNFVSDGRRLRLLDRNLGCRNVGSGTGGRRGTRPDLLPGTDGTDRG